MKEFTTFDLKSGNARVPQREQIQLPLFMITYRNTNRRKKQISNDTAQAITALTGIIVTVGSFLVIDDHTIISIIGMLAGVIITAIARYI